MDQLGVSESESEPEDEELEEGSGDEESDSAEEEEDEDEAEEDEEEQVKRTAIRSQLANLTFEELEALKSKLGTKVYNEALFGTKTRSTMGCSKSKLAKKFKRDNKNRPREISSKVGVNRIRQVVPVKRKQKRDPRFENLCGELNEEFWKKDYSFLREMAKEEETTMKEKLKSNKNITEAQKEKMKEYLQRMANKERSDAEKEKVKIKRREEKQENVQRVKEGKKPYFMKKSTRKYVELAEKYDELKASGKLESYLKKKRKKNAVRDKKSVKLQRT